MRITKQVALLIAVIIAVPLIAAAAIFWLAMQAPRTLPPFSTLYQGESDYRYGDGNFEGGCTGIRTMVAWRASWNDHVQLRTPRPPVPPVDFNVHMVLSCFLGWQSASGPSIEIVRIELTESSYRAFVVRNYTQTQLPVVTNPCHLVMGPASQNKVSFLDAATEVPIPEL